MDLFAGPNADPDRFALERQVASGGEGVVWKAVQVLDDGGQIDVAVKQLRVGHTVQVGDPQEVGRRWRNTAIRLRGLRSPGLVAVHDAFLGQLPHEAGRGEGPSDTPYFVMAWVDGEPLPDWAAGRTRWLDRIAVLDELAGGLDELHHAGLVHGDIKPQNILVTRRLRGGAGDDELALAVDFGLMRVVSQTPPSAATASALSPGFAAPETYEGHYSAASDLYAFAAVMYYLITDETPPPVAHPQAPEPASTRMSEIMQELAGAPAPVPDAAAHCRARLLARGLPAEAVDTIVSSLAANPDDRPHGAAALLRGFKSALAGALQGPTLAVEDVMGPDAAGLPGAPAVSPPPSSAMPRTPSSPTPAASPGSPSASSLSAGPAADPTASTVPPSAAVPEAASPGPLPTDGPNTPDEAEQVDERGYPQPPPPPARGRRAGVWRWRALVAAVVLVVIGGALFLNSRDRGEGPVPLRPGEQPPTTPAAAPPPPEARPAPGSTLAPGPELPPEPSTTVPSSAPVPRTVGPRGEVPLPRTPYSSLARQPQEKSGLDAFNVPWIAAPQLVAGQVHPDSLAFKPFFCNQRQGRAFVLDGDFARFDGLVALADSSSTTDEWEFRVLADGRSVYSGTIRQGEPDLILALDVTGVQRLEFGFLAEPNCTGGSTLVLASGQLRTTRNLPPTTETPPSSTGSTRP